MKKAHENLDFSSFKHITDCGTYTAENYIKKQFLKHILTSYIKVFSNWPVLN